MKNTLKIEVKETIDNIRSRAKNLKNLESQYLFLCYFFPLSASN